MNAIKLLPILFLAILLNFGSGAQAQVVIAADSNAVGDPSAILDIQSTVKGMLVPRMTAAQRDAISNPAWGLIIYCINCGDSGKLQMHNNYGWVDILNGPLSPENFAPVASSVTVSGENGVYITGTLATGAYTYSDAESNPEGTSIYKWYRADDNLGTNETQIVGASAITYTLAGGDLLKYIRFSVTPVAQIGFNPGAEVKSPWSDMVASSAPSATSVAQTGNISVGSILTGSYTYNDAQSIPEGTSIYKWYVADDASGTNEALISGATSTTYIIAQAYIGKYIRFSVTPSSSDAGIANGPEVKSSTWSGPVEANHAPVASSVQITGLAINGKTIVGSYSYSDYEDDAEGTTVYKWYVADDDQGTNQVVLSGANSINYTLQTANIGKYLRMSITPLATSGTSPGTEVFSSFLGPVLNAVPEAHDLSISGLISTGSIVTANYTYYDLEGNPQSGVQYKWYRADNTDGDNLTEIVGQTSSTYLLVSADINSVITFSVVLTSSAGTSPSLETFAPYHGPIIFEVTCGVQVLTSNINIGEMINSSTPQSNNSVVEKYCYNNIEANCINNGGLYQWAEAMNYASASTSEPSNRQGLCPTGYHIPSDKELSRYEWCVETTFSPVGSVPLTTFQSTTGGAKGTVVASKMKSAAPYWDGTNVSGFSGNPAGYVDYNYNFLNQTKVLMYWTATQSGTYYAYAHYLADGDAKIYKQASKKDQAHSIRCFKN